MEVVAEEDNDSLKASIDAVLSEQALKLYHTCDTDNKGHLSRSDLDCLCEFIPSFSESDLNSFYATAVNKTTNNTVNREDFVRVIKPYLCKKGGKNTTKYTQQRHISEIPRNMFKTISLDSYDSKATSFASSGNSVPSILPRGSVTSESNKDYNVRKTSDADSSQSPKPSVTYDSDEFDALQPNFFERSLSLPEDTIIRRGSVAINPDLDSDAIEKKNRQDVLGLDNSFSSPVMFNGEMTTKKPKRPCDFGPVSILDYPFTKEDIRTPDRIFKVVFVGDSAVGKTCFLHRFCHNRFKPLFNATIGVDFTVKSIKLRDRMVAVQLWDTAGQERFRSITKQYFRKADSVVLMYDVTSEQSFINVRSWLESIRFGVDDSCVLCLVGNKVDLASSDSTRKVTYHDGRTIAYEYGMLFFETSAFTGLGIDDCMRAIAIRLQQREDDQLDEALRLEMSVQHATKSWCCL